MKPAHLVRIAREVTLDDLDGVFASLLAGSDRTYSRSLIVNGGTRTNAGSGPGLGLRASGFGRWALGLGRDSAPGSPGPELSAFTFSRISVIRLSAAGVTYRPVNVISPSVTNSDGSTSLAA